MSYQETKTRMIPFLLPLALIASLISSSCTEKDKVVSTTPVVSTSDKGWTFETTPVFADEFDYVGKPNTAKWGYDVGGGGWGNNEKEFYTAAGANADVSNGVLTIEARRENMGGMEYTSCRMVTRNKFENTYGRFEAKIKLPTGRGLWPAFWMLPTDSEYGNWPKSGEIDVMEQVGYEPLKIHQSVHTEAFNHTIGTQKTASIDVSSATSAFQIYRVDWTPYAVRGYVNDVKVFEFVNSGGYAKWPFDKKFHMLLNIAVGGNWGGVNGIDNAAFPAQMQVDYVRVYRMIEK